MTNTLVLYLEFDTDASFSTLTPLSFFNILTRSVYLSHILQTLSHTPAITQNSPLLVNALPRATAAARQEAAKAYLRR